MDIGMGAPADEMVTSGACACPRCGQPVRRGPRAKWCSETCRVRTWQERRQAYSGGSGRGEIVPPSAESTGTSESTGTRNVRVVPPVWERPRLGFVIYDDRRPARKLILGDAVETKPAVTSIPGLPRGGPGVLVSPRDGIAAMW